jgi:tetratricopeptide (TPR) repeat protein
MIKTLLPLLLFCCAVPARAASDYLEEKARMEPFYGPYNRGVYAQLHGRLDEACGLFAQSAAGAAKMQHGWWQKYRGLLALGAAYHARRDFLQAEKYYLEGMAEYKFMHRDLGAVGLSGLGRLYLDQGLPKKAEPLIKEARDVEYKESAGKGDLTVLAAAVSDLGRLHELLGERQKAEIYYRTALKMLKGEGPPPFYSGLGAEQMDSYPIILYRLGKLYRRGGDAAASSECFNKALAAFGLWEGLEARPAVKARKLEYRAYTLRALGQRKEAAAGLKEAARQYQLAAFNE